MGQESSIQGLKDKLLERKALRARQVSLERSIRFLTTIQDVEAMLGLRSSESLLSSDGIPAAAPSSGLDVTCSSNPIKSMADVSNPEEFANRCAALERAAHSWVSLAADLG